MAVNDGQCHACCYHILRAPAPPVIATRRRYGQPNPAGCSALLASLCCTVFCSLSTLRLASLCKPYSVPYPPHRPRKATHDLTFACPPLQTLPTHPATALRPVCWDIAISPTPPFTAPYAAPSAPGQSAEPSIPTHPSARLQHHEGLEIPYRETWTLR